MLDKASNYKRNCIHPTTYTEAMSLPTRMIGNDSKMEVILNRHLCKFRSHYIEVGPKRIILPGGIAKVYERIKNFDVRDDDVFIFGFLKTGSRLIQEMVWLLLNNFDFTTAKEVYLEMRTPFFELEGFFDGPIPECFLLTSIDQLKSPRCIKSHLNWDLIPESIRSGAKKPKIIVVLRGPEDVCTSYYHQCVAEGYTGTWQEFCDLFLGGKVPMGPYWEHVLGFWEQNHKPNIMFLHYSEIIDDLAGTVRNVAKFLGVSTTEDDVFNMYEHLKFDNLKKNKAFRCDLIFNNMPNPFIRKGIIGDHKNVMSSDVIEEFQKQRQCYLLETGLNLV